MFMSFGAASLTDNHMTRAFIPHYFIVKAPPANQRLAEKPDASEEAPILRMRMTIQLGRAVIILTIIVTIITPRHGGRPRTLTTSTFTGQRHNITYKVVMSRGNIFHYFDTKTLTH